MKKWYNGMGWFNDVCLRFIPVLYLLWVMSMKMEILVPAIVSVLCALASLFGSQMSKSSKNVGKAEKYKLDYAKSFADDEQYRDKVISNCYSIMRDINRSSNNLNRLIGIMQTVGDVIAESETSNCRSIDIIDKTLSLFNSANTAYEKAYWFRRMRSLLNSMRIDLEKHRGLTRYRTVSSESIIAQPPVFAFVMLTLVWTVILIAASVTTAFWADFSLLNIPNLQIVLSIVAVLFVVIHAVYLRVKFPSLFHPRHPKQK